MSKRNLSGEALLPRQDTALAAPEDRVQASDSRKTPPKALPHSLWVFRSPPIQQTDINAAQNRVQQTFRKLLDRTGDPSSSPMDCGIFFAERVVDSQRPSTLTIMQNSAVDLLSIAGTSGSALVAPTPITLFQEGSEKRACIIMCYGGEGRMRSSVNRTIQEALRPEDSMLKVRQLASNHRRHAAVACTPPVLSLCVSLSSPTPRSPPSPALAAR